MLPFILAAATATADPGDRHAALLVMMQREGVCGDAPEETCAHAASAAHIRDLGSVDGSRIALVSFAFDDTICGNVNCPYLVVAFDKGTARKILWTDGYDVSIGTEVPLPSLRVTSHDSEDTSYISLFRWRDARYVRTEYLRERVATGETRPASIPIVFAPGAVSATVRGSVTHYWNATYEIMARAGEQLTITQLRCAQPLLIMLDGPNGLPVAPKVAAATPYALSDTGTYELSVYLDTTEGADLDQPFQFTVTVR